MEEVRRWWKTGTAGVVGIAVGTVLVHLATGWRYGFNRDELMALEDARHLAWGYVQYPPMTAFWGWVALKLFGTSLGGFRFFAAVAQAVALVLTGWMAKEMAGGKWAMVVAALAGVPFALGGGVLMQYIAFDYVCWVLVAYGMVRVLIKEMANGEGPFGSCPHERLAYRGVEQGKARKVEEAGLRWQGSAARKASVAENAWWWVVVGAGIGLGMMAKYTMGLLVAGVVAGVLLTGARRHLRSGWLWGGVLVAMGIFLPNFLWEWKRNFISVEFLRFLHERDVQEGATNGFFVGQLELMMFALPLAVAGLWFCFLGAAGWHGAAGANTGRFKGKEADAPYRAVGWMYVVPLVLLVVMRGRDYYLAPAYPMLYAAGAVWVERKWRVEGERRRTESRSNEANRQRSDEEGNEGRKMENGDAADRGKSRRRVRTAIVVGLLVDMVVGAAVALPIAPVNSAWWKAAAKVDIVFPEEIGWEEFVGTVAEVWGRLPAEEKKRAGILTGNYGEVGALNLYGERYGLPRAISGVNSSWERGYGQPAPQTVIVAGYSREFLEKHFATCEVEARTWNRYGVPNEETVEDPEIFVCRGLQESWQAFWNEARRFA